MTQAVIITQPTTDTPVREVPRLMRDVTLSEIENFNKKKGE